MCAGSPVLTHASSLMFALQMFTCKLIEQEEHTKIKAQVR